MKVLLTGGAGFIGSHITQKLLRENCQVVVLDNLSTGLRGNVPAGVKLIEMDICSAELLKVFEKEQFDAVIHLAAQTMVPISLDKPDYDCQVNIAGTVNVLEGCRKTGVKRVIFSSSAAVYGDVDNVPILENNNTKPTSFYGVSKLTVEKYLDLYYKVFGLDYVVLRYANVYGERQGDGGEGGVISIFTRKIHQNQPLTVFGDGGQTRDFIYAGDVAVANYQALITTNANTVYNISTQTETGVNQIIDMLAQAAGKSVEKVYNLMREGDIYRSSLANGKACERLDWKPVMGLAEGLARTYEYMKKVQSLEYSRNAFKAYDIRGRVPDELNEEVAYRIGRAYVEILGAKKVAVGHDIRLSSLSLAEALMKGLTDGGCDVVDIGLCGTEQIYFATFHLKLDGGIMVTASHNPRDYNGMKLVRSESRPISGDTGLRELEERVVTGDFSLMPADVIKGTVTQQDITEAYIQHLLSYIDVSALKPLKVVVNAGNGCAGPIIDALEAFLPFEFIKVNHEPDGTFPHGIPNPLLQENREATAAIVRKAGADVGIAWDGDFDRCFFFDEQGEFIEGYYIVGFLAQAFLRRKPGAKIIHDPRLTWNTIEQVRAVGGIPVQSKTGHAFIKERMRLEDAVYGGEMSAHHYFKDFAYCDSGMIPWFLVLEIMSREDKSLSALMEERMSKFPVSGEINRKVTDAGEIMRFIEQKYAVGNAVVDHTDGLSVEFDTWRFSLRMSNTEPVLRLNVEAKGDAVLMQRKTQELLDSIDGVDSGDVN